MPDGSDASHEILRKAAPTLRKLTKNYNASFKNFLKKAGIGQREWDDFCSISPHFAAKLRLSVQRKMEAGLMVIYDALFFKASRGDPAAIKLFLQRFDPEYVERKETKHDFGEEDATTNDLHRIMFAAYGEAWPLAVELAKQKKRLGGVLGEEFLEGGEDEKTDFGRTLEAPKEIVVPAKPKLIPKKTPGQESVEDMFGFEDDA